jgi:hypothetical protein
MFSRPPLAAWCSSVRFLPSASACRSFCCWKSARTSFLNAFASPSEAALNSCSSLPIMSWAEAASGGDAAISLARTGSISAPV